MASLIDVLNADDSEALREQVRALIDRIVLHPEGKSQRVEVHGALVGILGLAQPSRDGAAAVVA